MSGSGPNAGGSGAGDDVPFVLHLAFAAEMVPTGTGSPALRPRGMPLATPPGTTLPPSTASAIAAAAPGAAVPPIPSPVRSVTDPTTSQQGSPSPPSVGAGAHQSPFGYLSFPLKGSAGGAASAGATAASVASTHPGQVTLKHVRELLHTHFPPTHVAQLVSAGVLSSASARALQSGSFFFMAAGGGVSAVSVSDPQQLSIALPFLPVSPVQEEFVLAHHCCPVLVLKSSMKQSLPHGTPKPATPAKENGMAQLASGSDYVQDYLPSAPSQGGRRSSFDLSSQTALMRELQHQDTLTLLSAGQSPMTMHHYSSPPPAIQRATSLGRTPAMPSSTIMSAEEKHSPEDDSQSEAKGLASPKRASARALSGNSLSYHSLSDDWPVHFDDVIREKSSGELRGGAPPLSMRAASIRITVTGELLDIKAKRGAADTSRRPPRTPTRRHVNNVAMGSDVDDDREGSVKQFNSINDFLRDEERRRAKYDAAAAAYAAAMQNPDDMQTAESPLSGMSRATSSTSLQQREPLAQTPLWISIEDGDDVAVEHIGRYFGLHPLTVEDCQSRGIREKLEVFPEYLFLVFHAIDDDGTHHASIRGSASATAARGSPRGSPFASDADVMRTTPLKLVVFPSLVLSFHKGALPAVGVVRKQLSKLYRNRVLNTAWLIHGLLDVVSDSLMPVVDEACALADNMEDAVYLINPGRDSHKDVLRRMGAIARRLTFLRQRLWSKRDILTSLIEKDWQHFLIGVRVPYLRDIYDHLVIMLHKLDAAIEVIVTLQSTYLAVVSIDVAAVSNEGNSAMKTLSASATILLPLSLIASLMGMNVMVPFQFDAENITFRDLLPFSVICLCMLFISTTLYSYFKKQKYL